TFPSKQGQPFQQIHTAGPVPLAVVDLHDQPGDQRQRALSQLLSQMASEPFDLERGPLLRAILFQLSREEHVLLVAMHHIVTDGWSIPILVQELSTLYAAFCRGESSPLTALPVQYADFACWQREHLQGQEFAAKLDYWTHRLADAPAFLELPTDHLRPSTSSYRGAIVSFNVPQEVAATCQELGQQEGALPFITFLAAFAVLLSRYSGQQDLVIGTPIAGRQHLELEGLIGFFVNMLALRLDLSGAPSFRGHLRRVRAVALEAYGHQEVPFAQVVEALRPARTLSHHPVFQVQFTLTDEHGPQSSHLAPEVSLPIAKFDLSLALVRSEAGLQGTFEFATDVFEASTIERMAGHFQTLLAGIAHDPERSVSRLPLLTFRERAQVLETWNDTARDYAPG